MNEAEFHQQLDYLYDAIEDAVDELDSDIDCELSGSVLSLKCPDGSAIIFSRQSASSELWLATQGGGYHFGWDGQQWFSSKEQQSLQTLLDQACQQQIGESLNLDWDNLADG